MTKNILLIFLVSVSLCCHKEEERCTARNFRSIVLPAVQNYFPYKAGQKLLLKKYQDTAFIEDVYYTVNAPLFLMSINKKWLYDGCTSYDTTETYVMNITCDSDLNKGIVIKYVGDYAKGKYTYDTDNTALDLKFNSKNFTFYGFGLALVEGSFYKEIDSIIINGKNYGKSFYLKNYPDSKIYFNSKYGILKFENETTKEKYIYSE